MPDGVDVLTDEKPEQTHGRKRWPASGSATVARRRPVRAAGVSG
jgi:hypothetical protein